MMFRNKSVGMTAIVAALALSRGAFAQIDFLFGAAPVESPNSIYTNEAELGVGQVSEEAFRFGEYSGLEEEGVFVIGNISFQRRAVFDDQDTTYFSLRGTDLGLTSRSLQFEYGQQGLFNIQLGFSQIPKNMIVDARTPYLFADDGTVLVSPANWVPGDRDTSEMTELAASLNDIAFEHSRERYSGGFSLLPAKNWAITTNFTRELKDGSRTIAALFGTNGGNPGAAIIPEPIDYKTDTFDVSLGYTGKKGQVLASYHLSLFDNDLKSITFDNIYASTRWAPTASWPGGNGSIGLPPDNRAHRLRFSGRYLVNATTRATANLSWSRITQDQAFLDFTVNPDLVVTTPLPRASLDGEINTLLANLSVTMRPGPKLNVRTSYRYEDRDNQTPRDIFVVVHNDSDDQGTIDSSDARINVPYSRTQHLFELDAGYRISNDMKLTGGYEYEEISRTFSDVSKTREHRIDSKLRFTATQDLQGWAGVSYAAREGSTYDDNAHFVASHTLDYLGPDPDAEIENHPLVRKSWLSDRRQLKFRGAATWIASDKLTLGFTGRYTADDYDKTVVGLTESKGYSITFDASYLASETFNTHVWLTFDDRVFEQFGIESHPGTDLFDFSGRGWSVETDDRAGSLGSGFEWVAVKDKLDITLDATYLKAEASFNFKAGTLVSALPLPDLTTELAGLNLQADYHHTKTLTLRVRYLYQDLLIEDFARGGVKPDTLEDVLGLGFQPPDYSVHVVMLSTVYRF